MTGPAGRARAGWMAVAGTGTGTAASISVALLVLASVFVAVAGARASQSVPSRYLRDGLARLPSTEKSVLASTGNGGVAELGGQAGPARLTKIGERLRKNLTRAGLPLSPVQSDWSGLTTAFSVVTAGGSSAFDGSTPPKLELAYRDTLGRYARLVAGRMPVTASQGRAGGTLQVAVTPATARKFRLRVGSRLRVDPGFTLIVTGIIRPLRPRSAFWTADAVTAAPSLNYPGPTAPPYWLGAAFVGPAALGPLESSTAADSIQLSWGFPLAVSGLTAGQAGVLQAELADGLGQASQVSNAPPVTIPLISGLTSFLVSFDTERAAVADILDLMLVSLAAVGIVVVLLGMFLLAEQRRDEFALLRARGAARWQLAALALRAGAIVAVPAAVAGGVLAVAVTPSATGSLGWWLGGLSLAVALASLPLLTAFAQRSPRRAGRREPDRRAARRHAATRRLVTEIALIAAAVGGLVVAHQQGVAGASQDPLTSAAPVLVAIPAAIVAMRCYPLLARWLLRVAGRRRGAVVYVGLAGAVRTSLTSVLSAFALVLVLAMVAFGGMVRGAVTRGEVAASWQQTGADATVTAVASTLVITPAAAAAIAAVPGVQQATTVTMMTGTQANGTQVAVAVVSPRQYAALLAATPGPQFPAAALARPAGGLSRGSPVPAVAAPAAATALGQASTSLAIGTLGQHIAIRVVATALAGPAISAGTSGAIVVVPRWAVSAAAQPPNLMLVNGPALDGQRLSAVVRRVVPGAQVSLRSAALAALADAPLPHGTYVAYAVGIGAAAGFGILALLITLLLGAGPRERTLARLEAMGLSAGQARWLVMVEMLPEILVATACGAGCAWALAILVGPDLNLAPFTGTGAAVPVRAEPVTLVLAAAGLLVVALVTVTSQVVVAGRRGAARALRIGE
jgi:putative ABC transport system permease protein